MSPALSLLRRAKNPKDGDPVTEASTAAVETLTVEDDVVEADDDVSVAATPTSQAEAKPADDGRSRAWRRVNWSRTFAYGVLPGLALLLAMAVGFLKWQDVPVRDANLVRGEAVRAATDGTVALLSYKPDTVKADLEAARSRLTGTFLQAYTSLTHDVVIPGAQQKQISAVATVPAAAPTLVTRDHAVVLLFVNQTIVVGQDAPSITSSSVRVTVDKIGDRWLISRFDPV